MTTPPPPSSSSAVAGSSTQSKDPNVLRRPTAAAAAAAASGILHRPSGRSSPLMMSRPQSRAGRSGNGSNVAAASAPLRPNITSGASLSAAASAANNTPASASSSSSPHQQRPISTANYRLSSLGYDSSSFETRRHVIRFAAPGNRVVNPAADFNPPVKISRKDPASVAAVTPASTTANGSADASEGTPGSPHAAAESADAVRPKIDLAKVAPHGGTHFSKRNAFKRRTRQVFHTEDDDSLVHRYEERMPWVIEDFEGKNTWVGNMEGGQSSSHYMLFCFTDDGFKVIPANRFYKFMAKQSYHTLSIDEAEEKMGRKTPASRWFMRQEDANIKAEDVKPRMRTVNHGSAQRRGPASDDGEELDFNDEFADDEETPYIEGNEEDNRELEDRIKKEMLTANALGDAQDDGAADEDATKREVSKEGRRLMRYLKRLEKNLAYESDEDSDNPYASEDDDETSEGEAEEEQKGDQAKGATGAESGVGTPATAAASRDDTARTPRPLVASTIGAAAASSATSRGNKIGTHSLASTAPGTPRADPVYDMEMVRQVRPHLVTLKLPSARLQQFAASLPTGKPSVSALQLKRRRAGNDVPRKKARSERASSAGGAGSGSDEGSAPSAGDDRYLVTEDEVRELVQQKPMAIKDLLQMLGHKFHKDKRNRALIRDILQKVARLENGVLLPR